MGRDTEDVFWRRAKCGLEVNEAGERALARYMANRSSR